jgi:hypothetical protein
LTEWQSKLNTLQIKREKLDQWEQLAKTGDESDCNVCLELMEAVAVMVPVLRGLQSWASIYEPPGK